MTTDEYYKLTMPKKWVVKYGPAIKCAIQVLPTPVASRFAFHPG